MSAETMIAAAIAGKADGLRPGARILLEQQVVDDQNRRIPGPHTVGKLLGRADEPVVRLVSTAAGRTARALVEEEMLDVVVDPDRNLVLLGVFD
jgi:hypothetical protein